jgi:hypothetical protein
MNLDSKISLQVYLKLLIEGGGGSVDQNSFPKCQKCSEGYLVPLSDYGGQGASVHYKAWVCINPDCGFNIKIRNGDIYINEPIMSGAARIR